MMRVFVQVLQWPLYKSLVAALEVVLLLPLFVLMFIKEVFSKNARAMLFHFLKCRNRARLRWPSTASPTYPSGAGVGGASWPGAAGCITDPYHHFQDQCPSSSWTIAS